jgi:hypothetical protein
MVIPSQTSKFVSRWVGDIFITNAAGIFEARQELTYSEFFHRGNF